MAGLGGEVRGDALEVGLRGDVALNGYDVAVCLMGAKKVVYVWSATCNIVMSKFEEWCNAHCFFLGHLLQQLLAAADDVDLGPILLQSLGHHQADS